ncbi:MAG: hypothetical protein GC160_15965 [Acidobacteria bacterium]|nr:hypothetical protein [Acidobacteriota bacterium]
MQPTAAARPPRLEFPPAGAVTGVGSLPFTSPAEAVEAIAACSPEVPFWPQLPRLSDRESIVGQGLDALSPWLEPRAQGYGYQVKQGSIDRVVEALHRSDGALTTANAVGFAAFQTALAAGRFESACAVKGQIEGPVTLAAYLFHQGRPFLADPALFAAVAFHVSQILCWQIERLAVGGAPVLLFVDEPALCLPAPSGGLVSEERRLAAVAAVLDGIRARGAYAGLHCCAASPLGRMRRAQPDILSFDAHQGLEEFFRDPDARAFVRDGGRVAYGLIPTWQDLAAVDPRALFARWLTLASVAGDPEVFAARSMVTATCGLGLVRPETVVESFAKARAVGALLRALAEASEPDGEDQATVWAAGAGS